MYLAALREARRPHREDLVDWLVQAVLHDPLRGICILAERQGALVGIAAFESSATAEHGWSGRLACLYVVPESRHLGIGKWLLGESLEFARYYGLNHVVFDARPEDARVASLLSAAGLRSHPVSHYRIDLRPLYDES
jgi:ribosomal protein S18 acetylase RimI-like enzyme